MTVPNVPLFPTPIPIEWIEDENLTYTADDLIHQVGGYSGVGSCWDAPSTPTARLGRIRISDVSYWSDDALNWPFEEEESYMQEMVRDMKDALAISQEKMEENFPPLIVFRASDGRQLLVDDGYHRISAALAAGVEKFHAFIF